MYELKMKLIMFTLKQILLIPSESYSRLEGGLEKNPGVWRTNPELQKDSFTNVIPRDIFSQLNKNHVAFPFILLIIRLLLLHLYYKIHLWSSASAYAWGLSAFDEVGSYYQQSDNFFVENQFKKTFPQFLLCVKF